MRRLIFEEFKTVFDSEVDILLSPTTIGSAPSKGKFLSLGPVESTVYNTFAAPISLCGEWRDLLCHCATLPMLIPFVHATVRFIDICNCMVIEKGWFSRYQV